MKVLVLNAGSSSLKCSLFEMPEGRKLAYCEVERVGSEDSEVTFRAGGSEQRRPCGVPDHGHALDIALASLTGGERPVLDGLDRIAAVGHRVVHGGPMTESTLIDEETLETIRRNAVLAPLHNPPNLEGIEAATRLLPDRPQVAAFDTAFHARMPREAHLYALPYSLYAERGVRVYGFHGTSHRYVARRAAAMVGREPGELNLITMHLGNGCSAAAVRGGRSVDTSMGMTPLAGLVMGTRCGDIDPGLFYLLTEWLDQSPAELYDLLNRDSGLAGLSGVSNDVRELLAAASEGNERAQMALEVFCYRARKYVGAYFAVLGRVDGLIFTAGIGENSPEVRGEICRGLEGLGIALDPDANRAARGADALISAPDSPTAVLVVCTNEELQIATDVWETLEGAG